VAAKAIEADAGTTRAPVSAGRPRLRGRAVARWIGNALIVAGILLAAYALLVVFWHDPFTDLYTRHQQGKLAKAYEARASSFDATGLAPVFASSGAKSGQPTPRATAVDPSVQPEWRIARTAAAYRRSLHEGDAMGRIVVPRLGLRMILVNGTSTGSLEKGPGRDLQTWMPGEGKLVYIAGHRTTYLAPFRHIERLSPGDRVTLQVPYGTFKYQVTRHVIVPADDLARLRNRGRDEVALQACHPRFFATHRYIVYAKLVGVSRPER
jgi:sortase A